MKIKRCALILLVAMLALFACAAWCADEEIEVPRHDFPTVNGYQVLVGDFHCHTNSSDGKLTPQQRAEESRILGYDVIAVTDHGTMKSYRMARYYGIQQGVLVMTGFETGINGKEHMNAIGIRDGYQPKDSHKWATKPGEKKAFYQDEMKGIAAAGGIIIYNHPHVGYREPVQWGVKQGYIVGIEVKNDVVKDRWNTTKWNGIDCYPEAFDYALKNNLALFADTDAHGKRNETPAKTLIFVKDYTPEGVMDAIKGRRTVAWFNDVVWGREALLTDLFKTSIKVWKSTDGKLNFDNFTPIPLKASVAGSDGALEIPAYGSGSVDAGAATGKTVKLTLSNVWTSPKTNLTIMLPMMVQVK